MRTLLTVLAVIALAFAGYYIFWHKKAEQFEQTVAAGIQTVNDSAKADTKNTPLIRYESLNVTGFPFAMSVEVRKPVLSIPVSEIMRSYPGRNASSTQAFQWLEEVKYEDRIVVSSNLIASQFTYTILGDITQTMLIDKQPRHAATTRYASPPVCHLGFEPVKGSTAWNIQPLPSDLEKLAPLFRYFDCKSLSGTSKDAKTGAPLYSSDEVSYSASYDPSAAVNRKLAFKIIGKKLKASPADDAVIHDYMLMAYTLIGKADAVGTTMPISEYGEHDMKADFSYDGPFDFMALTRPDASLKLDLNALEVHSALSNLLISLHISSLTQGDSRTVSVAFHEGADTNARANELGKRNLVEMLTELQKHPASANTDPAMKIWYKLASLGTPQATVNTLYPDMAALGKVAFDIDFSIKSPSDYAKAFRQGDITLNAFNITTTPYGITNKGSTHYDVAHESANGDLTLTCLGCDALIQDLGNYILRVTPLLKPLNILPVEPIVTQPRMDGLRQFLHAIADNGNARDLVIRFAMKDLRNITIGGKQLPEVMAIYMSTLAPAMPASGASPAMAEPGLEGGGPIRQR